VGRGYWRAGSRGRSPTFGRDLEAGNVSVRLHHGGPQGAKPKAEVVAEILADIKERKA